MRKPPLQDVVVKPHRSGQQNTQDMHTVRPRRVNDSTFEYADNSDEYNNNSPFPPRRNLFRRNGGTSWFIIAVGIAAVIVVLAFVFSLMFGGAHLTVYPRTVTTTVNASFQISKEPLPGELGFESMTIVRTKEQTVTATETAEAEERASGKLTIYNDFDDNTQRLIKNTRFESPDGQIFRIRESVDVPGQNTEGGSTVPGSVEVIVYADEPGEAYNIAPARFTIPGFEESPRFEAFYAESSEAMQGGFAGERHTVSEATKQDVHNQLETALADELKAAAFADGEVPEDFVLFNDAVFFEYVPQPQRDEANQSVVLSVEGTLHGILINKNELAEFLAGKTIASYDGNAVRIEDIGALTMSVRLPEDAEEGETPWSTEILDAQTSGTAEFVWEFEEMALKDALMGEDEEAMPTVLSGFPGINRAEAIIRPFWRGAFPEDINDITVETVLDSS